MTYAEFCKTKCEWCAKGVPLFGSRVKGVQHDCSYPHALQPCAAPTAESAFTELSQERDTLLAERQKDQETIAELREAVEDWIAGTKFRESERDSALSAHKNDQQIIAELREEIRAISADRESWRSQCRQHNIDRIDALSALRQVRLDVEKAEHDAECATNICSQCGLRCTEDPTETHVFHESASPCNCWKSTVLAEIEKVLEGK